MALTENILLIQPTNLSQIALMMLLTLIPIKFAAEIVGAQLTSLIACVTAAILAGLCIFVVISFFKGVITLPLIFTGLFIIYWRVLQPTLKGAFMLTCLVALIQVGMLQVMERVVI
ncbi:hypothetical protein [Shewanella marina]|uniref:hypothetical protein n=1 Tax=Shewanella marina TaxID=487319 RepID=UPI000472BCED|nr:hypothetical protein [Shewanella marina]